MEDGEKEGNEENVEQVTALALIYTFFRCLVDNQPDTSHTVWDKWDEASIVGILDSTCIGVRIISSPNMTGQAKDGIRNS